MNASLIPLLRFAGKAACLVLMTLAAALLFTKVGYVYGYQDGFLAGRHDDHTPVEQVRVENLPAEAWLRLLTDQPNQ